MSTRILALDTATEACSAALMLDENNVFERFTLTPREHAQRILPMVDSLLAEAGIALNDLNALAFGRGPGSFTGVRIGIGIAQGLALGADLPLIGVSTLAALAEGAWRQVGVRQVLTAIDAHIGAVYWARYQRQAAGVWLGEDSEAVLTPEALSVQNVDLTGFWAIAGTGWQTYPTLMALINNDQVQLISGQTLLPSARDMLPLAFHYYRLGGARPVEYAEPSYLRNEVEWKKLPGRE